MALLLLFAGMFCRAGAQHAWSVSPGFSYGYTPSYNVTSSPGRKAGFMWRGGVRGACSISRHIGMGAGIELSHYDYDMKYRSPGLLLHRQQQSFVEIPLFLSWVRHDTIPAGFRPVLSVAAGFILSVLTGAHYEQSYSGYVTEGNNSGDFKQLPVKALLYAGAAQHVGRKAEITMGIEFTSLFGDNISKHPSVVNFLPGSLVSVALRMGCRIRLHGR